ncbi:MAG TPA: DUF2235 domain-containing protein [Aliiroseovarius sp.]|nr:DUF2235 domain-containing protein [Aliiroseovarius sp.]
MFGKLAKWLKRPGTRAESPAPRPSRGPVDHVVILDGTMSSLEPGCESNAGLTYKLLCEMAPSVRLSLMYEAGVQFDNWGQGWHVATGVGINRQIRRAYGFIASRYRPGDRIFLFGYSRGAFAVRSLAGAIDQVGLLTRRHATPRHIRDVYRHYQSDPNSPAARAFARAHCHEETPVEMIGVWDTVKALGLTWPVVWRLFEPRHRFHNTQLGDSVRHGFHALAMDETREAFAPVLWRTNAQNKGRVEQMWFGGAHGDVGGQLGGFEAARPLSNIPLVWMLGRAEYCGLALPMGWRARFPCDANAPSVGTWRGWGKLFLHRKPRVIGRDASEGIFPLFADRARGRGVFIERRVGG